MAYVPVAAPVYASAEQLEQFASPQTSSRYAVIPGLGMFAWYPLDSTARNGTTVLGTGVIGRWKLSDTFGNGSVWKQACFVAADSNVTLSGTQTIDGQSVTAGKVVFCTAQTAPAENGPWTCAAGAWSRPSWFDAAADAQSGAMFPVIAGTTYGGSLWMLTSPTSGTITPGTTAITVEQVSGGGAIVESTLTLPLTLSENQSLLAPTVSELAIDKAASGHINGTTTRITIQRYTVESLRLSPSLNVRLLSGATFTEADFDDTKDTIIELVQTGGFTKGLIWTLDTDDTAAPQPLFALVPTATPNRLTVRFSKPVTCDGATTGLSLSFTSGTARTITGIRDGEGTDTITFWLSGTLALTEVFDLVFASTNAAKDMQSVQVPAQSIGCDWLSTPDDVGMWLWEASSGYSVSAGTQFWVSLYDNGAEKTMQQATAGNQATLLSGGYDGEDALSFDGSNDYITTPDAISTYINDDAALLMMALVPGAVSLNAGLPQQNDGYIGHGYIGLHAKTGGGTDTETAMMYNFDGSTFGSANVGIQPGRACLLTGRHQSGNLYIRRDNAAESAATASGLTNSIINPFVIGSGTTTLYPAKMKCMAWGVADLTSCTATELTGIRNWFQTRPYCEFLVPKIVLPSTHFAVVGVATRIVFADIVLIGHEGAVTWTTTGIGSSTSTVWSYTPGAGEVGNQTLTIYAANAAGKRIATRTITVKVSAAALTGSKVYLEIGDSTGAGSNGARSEQVRSRLTTAGATVTMVGTAGGYSASATNATDKINVSAHPFSNGDVVEFHKEFAATLPTDGTGALGPGRSFYVVNKGTNDFQISLTNGGAAIDILTDGSGTLYVRSAQYHHECRSGWSAADFHTGRTGDADTSPFLYDGSTLSRTLGKFDARAYLNAQSLAADPTHVTIALGINDMLTAAATTANSESAFETAVGTYLAHVERMAQGFIDDVPGVKVLILGITPPKAGQAAFTSDYPSGPTQWEWRRVQMRALARMIRQFDGRTSEGIVFVPSHVVDPSNDYVNGVHMLTAGGQYVGDQLAAAIQGNP